MEPRPRQTPQFHAPDSGQHLSWRLVALVWVFSCIWGAPLLHAQTENTPVADLLDETIFEPLDGTKILIGHINLTPPLTEPGQVRVRRVGGTASPGIDHEPIDVTITLPVGVDFAEFGVVLQADEESEGDETLDLEISEALGASVGRSRGRWTILDREPAPVVSRYIPINTYERAKLFEGAPSSTSPIWLSPQGRPLSVRWHLPRVGRPEAISVLRSPALAEPGVDMASDSGIISTTTPGTQPVILSALADEVADPGEEANVIFDLPPGVHGGSFGRRFVDILTGSAYSRFPSTDGQWVVIPIMKTEQSITTMSELRIYARPSTSAAGWTIFQTIPAAMAGVDRWPWSRVKLRNGRIIVYAHELNRVWIFAQPESAEAAWTLESSMAVPDRGEIEPSIDFDGDGFVLAEATRLHIYERGDGTWNQHSVVVLDDESGRLIDRSQVDIDGPIIACTVRLPDATPAIQVLRRTGGGAARWRKAQVVRVPDLTSEQPFHSILLSRDRLAVTLPGSNRCHLFRIADDESWRPEQIIEELRAMGRSLLFGGFRVYGETGPPGEPWQVMGPSPWTATSASTNPLDLHNNVMIKPEFFEHDTGSGTGFSIHEPGADYFVVDEDTFSYTPSPKTFREGVDAEELGWAVVLATESPPMDVTLGFRSVSGGTATEGVDFRPVEGTMVMKAGSNYARFMVPILPDRVREPDETIRFEVFSPSYGQPLTSQPVMTIQDQPLVILPPDPPMGVFEPRAGEETFVIPFRLARPMAGDTRLNFRVSALTAVSADVVLATSARTIPAGQTTIPVPLTVKSDALPEYPESVLIFVNASGVEDQNAVRAEVKIYDVPGSGTADAYTTLQNVPLDFSMDRNVLANDPDETAKRIQPALPAFPGVVDWRADGTFRFVPSANFVGVDTFAYRHDTGSTTSVPPSAAWRWLHPLDGKDPETAVPGFQTGWTSLDFDDTAWQEGGGLMGYGSLGTGTGHPIDTDIGTPPVGQRYSAYFRTKFQGPETPAAGLSITLSCDDAAIVYLNGRELGRKGKLPLGSFATAPDLYTLLAPTFLDGEEETQLQTLDFPTAQAIPGENVLAISLHNQVSGSSDLGLKVADITIGIPYDPVRVDVTVTDADQPPVLRDDVLAIPGTTSPLDSMFYVDGSAYANDDLFRPDGMPYDPILEVEVGGTPIGPVTFDRDTGHYKVEAPTGFFGTTSFTYRLKDIDGWSNTATVTLSVAPSRNFDAWRQAEFGGGSANPLSEPSVDADGDGLANFAEFALGTPPAQPTPGPLLELKRVDGVWILELQASRGFGQEAFIAVERSPSLIDGHWQQLAALNDIYVTAEFLAPGVTSSVSDPTPALRRYTISLPANMNSDGYLRLRVFRERHAENP